MSLADEKTDTELERRARAAFDAGDHARAVTLCIEGYGEELFGYLVSRMGSHADAADVFSDTTERVWRTLSSFEWRCSLRSWLYLIARNQANTWAAKGARRKE